MKLTRKQIAEGLKQQPIEKLLLGADSKTTTLTKKQRDFAEKVANGEPKAKAYREAYNSNGKPTTQARNAHELANNTNVQTMIERLKLANEATAYLLPVHLRSLIVQKLTEKALDDNIKTSDQLRAIELLGKLTEVSAFTERKEIVKQADTTEAKAKLINAIANAIKQTNTLSDDKRASAESLLNEIANAREMQTVEAETQNDDQEHENAQSDTPPSATPHFEPDTHRLAMHTIPDKQLPTNGVPDKQSETNPVSETDGHPGVNSGEEEEDRWWEDAPVTDLDDNVEKNI